MPLTKREARERDRETERRTDREQRWSRRERPRERDVQATGQNVNVLKRRKGKQRRRSRSCRTIKQVGEEITSWQRDAVLAQSPPAAQLTKLPRPTCTHTHTALPTATSISRCFSCTRISTNTTTHKCRRGRRLLSKLGRVRTRQLC